MGGEGKVVFEDFIFILRTSFKLFRIYNQSRAAPSYDSYIDCVSKVCLNEATHLDKAKVRIGLLRGS